jgi:HPt (histidine-containing phosphotransfer) domain-containing protein
MDQEEIQKRLAGLWQQHLQEIADRVAVLERACSALDAGRLSEEERRAATAAAHKLAGVLGTFGQMRGTELARTIEGMLERESGEANVRSLVNELRRIVGTT